MVDAGCSRRGGPSFLELTSLMGVINHLHKSLFEFCEVYTRKKWGATRACFLSCLFIDVLCEQRISGRRLTACGDVGTEAPCSSPDSPVPLLAWTSSLQLELSGLYLTYFLSYRSSQVCLTLRPQTLCLFKCI